MSHMCATVTIETEAGPVNINECDFDESLHTLYTEEEKTKEPTKDEIMEQLKELEVDFDPKAKKAVLSDLLDEELAK